ncbi:MAG: pyridoxamine 5'-phosphate oxidase family protein [Anaerolineae bacterium]|jgi:nitroimidazol reductase NimA-like FMN-containing flavoprotein (pyridoxamine 5'-phosphate oxidase superfamily)|nr:MAG: pyridoxamine 5'-phosphate oxidase family protein [Anaerolineae bacterium]
MNTHPKPFNAIFREQYAQNDQWIEAFLHNSQIGHVATRWENQPFLTPVLFWYEPQRRRIYFHTNLYGRLRTNSERFPEVCFETSEMGKLLPSNIAFEFSVQYASVVAFGKIRIIEDAEEKELGLMGLLQKYFPDLKAGVDYRPITQDELDQTAVFCIEIEQWSGKKNWKEEIHQDESWSLLDQAVLRKYGF